MKTKVMSYLGFAKKSGNLVTGTGTCQVMAKQGKLKLLIITEDTAPGSREKAERLAEAHQIPYRIYGDSTQLSRETGTAGRVVFGITDQHFAKTIAEAMDREETEKEVFE